LPTWCDEMNDVAIEAHGLGKRYRLGEREPYRALRDIVAGALSAPFRGLTALGRRPAARIHAGSSPRELMWALKDVSFEIRRGEVVGIIGRNGAGKSTLLKLLSRITKPTTGHARIRGRVGSLLEVGTGFHPELTGRENTYLNGVILGMTKADIDRRFDEIVDFAEIEQFVDTPVKRYSSGMYVRLAFAVAAHLEPEILIVDEVLAVGDLQFQRKCLGKMGDVAKQGRTILFVSHNMASVSALCTSGLLLDKGTIVYQGETADCIAVYSGQSSQGRENIWTRPIDQDGGPLIVREIAASLNGEQPELVLDLDLVLESRAKHKPAFVAVDILSRTGTPIMQALPRLDGFIEDTTVDHDVRVSVQLPPLIPGQYLATMWVGSHNTETFDEVAEAVMFEVLESPTAGRSFPHTIEHGYVVPPSTVQIGVDQSDVELVLTETTGK
jgi:lipopolysaccharide transport system ATP-binding protein